MVSIQRAVEALRKKSIAKPNVMVPPKQSQIDVAERALKLTFPPGFRVFLDSAGSYQLPFWQTYWVGDDSLGYRNIVKANRCIREEVDEPLPPFLVTFAPSGGGDHECFDTRYPDERGEYPIIFWDHEMSAAENMADLEPLYSSFAEWLMDEVEQATRLDE